MYGLQRAPAALAHLWLIILFLHSVISPSLDESTATNTLGRLTKTTVVPGKDGPRLVKGNYNLAGDDVTIGDDVQPPKIASEALGDSQTKTDLESNSSIDAKNGLPSSENEIQAENLSGWLVEKRSQASIIQPEEVFGVQKKISKEKKKNTRKHALPAEPQNQSLTPKESLFLSSNVPTELLKTWREKKFNLKILFVMASQLRIQNREAFVGIVPYINSAGYENLKSFWMNSGYKAWVLMEKELAKIFEDRLEAKRRILALRLLLHHHTIAERWSPQDVPLWRLPGEWRSLIKDMQKAYGISANPHDVIQNVAAIPMRKWGLDSAAGPTKLKIRNILVDLFGETELKKRQELYDYKMNRVGSVGLWCRREDLHNSQRLGVDILAVWKIADALQFGSKNLLENAEGRMTFDSAFAQIIRVITAKGRVFSWVDSPERAWLYIYCGSLLIERLAKLSGSVLLSEHTNPLSTTAVKSLVGNSGMINGGYGRGLEIMHWCDLGLDPKEWARIRQIRKSGDPEEIEKLNKGMSKISDDERKKLQIWHQLVINYDAQEPRSIASKITRTVSECVDRSKTAFLAFSQQTRVLLKDKLDQINPWL
ncbi:hypothetical protein PtA15_5A518 [Puccinia triticina]|uniref:RxLR effector protein n=1 Tax=Puccinia triticina TaxID=208348 RepID=A0ABY7CJN7_9BASI|nr:uncharacterized protein PtA15_5A518 [Puccinia triticina]WAQ84945.1 hypothetical protein PtA15_5A518 [Puccinia triticina]